MKFLKKIYADPVLFGTFIVTVSVLFSSVFSYLLQLTLARYFTIEDYGTFNVLLSVAYVASVPITVLTIALIKISAQLKTEERFDKLTSLFIHLNLLFLALGSLLAVLIALLRGPMSSALRIHDSSYVLAFGIFTGVSFLSIVPAAYLQGLLRFKAFSAFMILGALFRFVFPVGLVHFGYGINGAFVGMALALVCAFIVSLFLLKKNFRSFDTQPLTPYVKKMLYFSAPVLFINLGMMLLNNIDIILVKKFFDSESVGYYASVVTIGKILLFGAGTVTLVMFPQVAQLHSSGKSPLPVFKKFLFLQLLAIGAGTLLFALLPNLIVSVLFGQRFLPAVGYLSQFALFMCLYVLINFMVTYFLAIEKTRVFLLQIPIISLQVILIYIFHSNLYEIININIFVSLLLLILLSMYFSSVYKKHNTM